jgi:hypothetical protein
VAEQLSATRAAAVSPNVVEARTMRGLGYVRSRHEPQGGLPPVPEDRGNERCAICEKDIHAGLAGRAGRLIAQTTDWRWTAGFGLVRLHWYSTDD